MSAKKYPSWLPPVAFIGVLGLALLLSNQPPSDPRGHGLAIISPAEYDAAKSKMEGLSLERLNKYDDGVKLSEDDLKKLREAGEIIDRMNQFRPISTGLFFLSGKIHRVLGENSIAEERFLQSVLVAPNNVKEDPADEVGIRMAVAEANYQLSLLRMERGKVQLAFDTADAAVKINPKSPFYLTARASALNELRRTDEAKRDLVAALKIDPKNQRAASLLKFISRH